MTLRFFSSLNWIARDGKLIILSRGIRTFAQSFVAVLLVLYLDQLGFSLLQIGAFLSAGVASSAFFAFLTSLTGQTYGRRRLLVTFALMSSASGLALFFVDDFIPLIMVAFLGSMGEGGQGPLQPLEQATLPDTTSERRRTDLFAIYGIVARAGAALGSLAAALPALFQSAFDVSVLSSYKLMFLGYAALQLLGGLLYFWLSPAVESRAGTRDWSNPLKLRSRRPIFTLTGLFSVDHFAGSLILQSLVAYWFATKFDLELGSLAFLFFLSNVLTAVSLWLAAKIASRIGLLNTMVFTHIPSSVFLIGTTLAPTAWVAVLFWQLRAFLGQMDVPTRESYTMAIVDREERVAMASIQIVGRNVMGTAGPSAGTALWNALSSSAPFIACGVLKIAYDLSLYFVFRNVRPPEEARRRREKATVTHKES